MTTASKRPAIPKWASNPFNEFLDHSERLGQVLELTLRGISVQRAMPQMAEALAKVHGPETKEKDQLAVEQARRLAELAEREVAADFPLVHGQALVAGWAMLEALIRGFVAEWLRRVPESLETQQVSRLRMPLAEYMLLSEDERYYFIADQLDRQTSAPLKRGVGRFETLLEPLGLSGPVESGLSRDLYELSEIRNVLVHRSGVADARLVRACPWLDLSTGSSIDVDHDQYMRLSTAIQSYVLSLIVRIGEHFGASMDGFKKERPPAAVSRGHRAQRRSKKKGR